MIIEEVEKRLPSDYKCYSREIYSNMEYYGDSFEQAVKRRFSNVLAQQDILGN